MKNHRLLVLLWLAIGYALPIHAQETTSESLEDRIDALFAEYQMKPGAVVGIFKGDKVHLQKGYGLANLDYEIPVTPQSVFELASLSKQFTAACILSLEAEGKIQLDDPIQQYLPEIPVYKEGTITIRQLLHHTSGIRDYMKLMYVSAIPWDANFTDADALGLMQKQRGINFVPGSQYRYTNSGHMLLALIVKRVSGMPISAYAKEKLFDPIGMKNTLIFDQKGITIHNRAIGYEDKGDGYVMEHYYNFVTPGDGGVYSTVSDYFKWTQNFKHNKTAISNFSEKMWRRGILNNGDTISYAQGLVHSSYRGVKTIVHSGIWGGFNSMFVHFPTIDLSVVVFSNNANFYAPNKAYQVVDLFFENGLLNSPSATANNTLEGIHLSSTALERFSGHYFNPIEGYSRRLYVKNDTLRYQRSSTNESLLVPLTPTTFSMLGAADVRIQMVNQSDQMQMNFLYPGESPIVHERYEPKKYEADQLKAFTGHYYCEEQDITYTVSVEGNGLVLHLGRHEIAQLTPVMKNIFNHPHFGYVEFTAHQDGTLAGFTISDDSINNIYFARANQP